jgi:hypothetical protein
MQENLPQQRNGIGIIFEVIKDRVGIERLHQGSQSMDTGFLDHSRRILRSSRMGSGLRPFQTPRAFSQIACRSLGVISG